MSVTELDNTKYAIVDIKGIWLKKGHGRSLGKFSNNHYCQRKTAVLCWNGGEMVLEGVPCVPRWAIDSVEEQTFEHCRKKIHHLSYKPMEWAPCCQQIARIVKNFLRANCTKLILFKG